MALSKKMKSEIFLMKAGDAMWEIVDIVDFARRYCAALSERMFALVRCGRYLGGGPEGVPAPIVAPTCEDEPR